MNSACSIRIKEAHVELYTSSTVTNADLLAIRTVRYRNDQNFVGYWLLKYITLAIPAWRSLTGYCQSSVRVRANHISHDSEDGGLQRDTAPAVKGIRLSQLQWRDVFWSVL